MQQTLACLKTDGSDLVRNLQWNTQEKKANIYIIEFHWRYKVIGSKRHNICLYSWGKSPLFVIGGKIRYVSLLVSLHRTYTRFVACCIEINIYSSNKIEWERVNNIICYDLDVVFPQNSDAEILTTNMVGPFGGWLGREGRAFINGISAVIEETPESSLPLYHVKLQWEDGWPRRQGFTRHQICQHLDLVLLRLQSSAKHVFIVHKPLNLWCFVIAAQMD